MYNKVADYKLQLKKVQYIKSKNDCLIYTKFCFLNISSVFISIIIYLHYGFLIFTFFVGEMKIPVLKVLSYSDYKKVFKLPTIAK